jgi:hypothetical protein
MRKNAEKIGAKQRHAATRCQYSQVTMQYNAAKNAARLTLHYPQMLLKARQCLQQHLNQTYAPSSYYTPPQPIRQQTAPSMQSEQAA